MPANIIDAAFSKHNSLPRTSILFAVCFLAGFMGLNIFSFHENSKRIELIETINRENLPQELSQIQQILTHLDGVLDNTDKKPTQQKAEFEKSLALLKEKLLTLQNDQLPNITSVDLTQNFVGIYGTIDGMEDLESKKGLTEPKAVDELMAYLHTASAHFFEIDRLAQQYHKQKIDGILSELRTKEIYLLGISLAFVVLGTVMIIFLLVDLFRRGELLERANQAERLKNSFFAMMSHEIRTPINGILGTLSLLNNTKLDHQQKHLTGIVHTSAASLLVIVNDVLDYSKIEAGKLELEYSNYNIKNLLDGVFELIRPLASDKKLAFTYNIQESIQHSLHSDPARIRQILLNFLSNAIKFTDKGSVTLYLKEEVIFVSGLRTPMLRFEVVDTGMGISEESKSHLFREFSQVDGSYSRRFAGTGLGLAICRRLTDMMKGNIGVHSEVGKGSTFWFSIPFIAATENVPEQAEIAHTHTVHQKACVLLVEDNPTNQMIAEAFLKQGGHDVDIADNGKKAVEAVKYKIYDVVFMDIAMPEMDGLAATKAIRALPNKKDLPIIAMTAHAMRGDREECLAAGMNDYITKPLSREILHGRVAMWVKQKPSDVPATSTQQQSQEMLEETSTDEISDVHFNQILQDLGIDNLIDFSQRFYDDLQSTGQAMLDAHAAQKWDVVKLHSHSLKSSTLSFGLLRLSQLAATIETQCKEKTIPDPDLLKIWPERAKIAMAELDERMKSLTPSVTS